MNFQFIIPFKSSDLLNSEGDSYFVKRVYDVSEIPDKLKECKRVVLEGDAQYIFDHFDTYFSIIENYKNVSPLNLQRSFDLLFVTVDKLGKKISPILKSNDFIGDSDRNSYLNMTKMIMYLMIETVKCIDHTKNQAQIDSGQTKKGGRKRPEEFDNQDWDQKRFKFLVQLYNIMQLPLEKLWNPPVAEENFVNMICEIAYRTLETQAIKERTVGDTVFQILGTAIKKYNHAMAFPVRIVQTLRTNELSLAPTAKGIHLLYEEFGLSSIFGVLIKDITDTLSVDSADIQVSRYFSTFLSELSIAAPKLMIPHLSNLGEELLNLESHVLRNCVLQIMGDVITCELTSEELADDLKEIRDEFLEDLLSHINDISAHVRSKVLQIWNHMKEENAVPLAFQHKVLRCGVERLDDKTAIVRKAAVNLIKTFLERNPFAAKLTLAELIKRYEEETDKLQKLHEMMAEKQKKAAELERRWEEEVAPELNPIIEEFVGQSTQEHINIEEACEDMVERINQFITEKKYKEAVVLAKRADFVAGNAELRLSLKYEEQCAYFMVLLKSYLFLSNGCSDNNEEYVTQQSTVKFLEDSIEFSKIVTKAVPKIQNMLMSKTNSDVFEAADFFTTAYLFGIKGTECGMRHLLYLVWSGDQEKRDAVSNAYKRVLFTTDLQGRAHSIKVVKNLCALLSDLSYGHYTALEVLINEWVESNDIDAQIIQVLFEHFTMKVETNENESRQALQLLIMTSAAKSSIATANISVIESIGLEERAMKDPRIYTGCLSFMLNSVSTEVKSKFYKRYDENHTIVQKTLTCFKKFFFHPKVGDFDNISMRTIEFLYQLCQAPDVICQNVIIEIHSTMKEFIKKIETLKESLIADSQDPKTQEPKVKIPVFLLSRFLFFIGYATMKEMIFLDIDIYNNMKFREDLKEQKNNLKKKIQKRKSVNLNMSASASLKRLSGTAAEPQQEPDEELVGATAEDTIAELINHICEDKLVFSDNGLLSKILPIIIEVCKYPTKYRDEILQQAASLALIRIMTVSSRLCESHMPFLMNILSLTTNIKIKCNIVVGLSDLTFRFPNVLGPWTGHFYSTLHENNDELRLTAVKMLSHLILHEMIRVRGQIADLAMCIVDNNEEIKNITQQFFKEIAHKSNILYNVLPDIISKLSDTNLNLEEEKYHVIMRYILGLIQKDKQVESLVEKLCLRFRVTTEERQWRDIAFCLSLLNYNEKTIKKLIDNVQHFKDKVQIEEVYQSFKTIISNSSKLAKPELKTVLTEFESRLNECLNINDNEEGQPGGENAEPTSRANPANKQKQTNRKKPPARNKKNTRSSSESESSENDDFVRRPGGRGRHPREQPRGGGRPPKEQPHRLSRTKKVTRVVESESSEESDVPIPKRGKTRR